VNPPDSAPPAAALARALSWLVIALIAAAVVYASWIAFVNWDDIAV
jgi:hypothetical protein